MRVGIMSWFHYHNYGTALQVTALYKKIKSLSHSVDIINYIPLGNIVTIPDKKRRYFRKGYSLAKKIIWKKIIRKDLCKIYEPPEREKLFDIFYDEHLSFTEPCETLSELENLNDKYNVFVCGSDQIWSPLCFDPHYFLDFVKDPKKMIAYAPSVGNNRVADCYIESEMKKLTARFKYISTREEQGSLLIEKMNNNKVETVLDPTLLLTEHEWTEMLNLSENIDEQPYLLVYFLGNNKFHWKIVDKLAKLMKLEIKIIPVFTSDLERKGCIYQAIGPREFVKLIKNATYICTDSFHGTIFSINFQKRFCVLERFKKNDKRNQNLRIYNILNLLGLEKCLLKTELDIKNVIKNIDYTDSNKKIKELRKKSIKYLTDSLKQIEDKTEGGVKNHINYSSLCCGCGVCTKVCPVTAIAIKIDEYGFYKAYVDEKKCISCGKCKTVCPFMNKIENVRIDKGELYSYKDFEEEILKKSSSGGIAYRISKKLLDDGYAVVGCVFDKDKQNSHHVLITPEKKKNLHLLQGSKYMQSDFAAVIESIQAYKNPIAIFGTPCQIAGIKRLLKDRDNVLYIDLICHGVPSYLVYTKYQQHLADKYGITSKNMEVVFRYKPKGWHKRHIMVLDSHKTICNGQKKDYFFRMFESCNCYSASCYECRWRNKCEADIRIGDYWGEKFIRDETGISMVLTMTPIGKTVVKNMINEGNIVKQPFNDYIISQQIKNLPKPVFYQSLINDLKDDEVSFKKVIKKYVVPFEHKNSRVVKLIKEIYNNVQQ